jgi:hypothetical protein
VRIHKGFARRGSLSCPPLHVKLLGIIVHSYLAFSVHSYFSVTGVSEGFE